MLPKFIDTLQELQCSKHSLLLETIDNLREQGLSSLPQVPQLIVCGNQCSGKSSVLEAVSGIPFPKKKDSLCTTFAIEVILSKSEESEALVAKAYIIPGKDRSDTEKLALTRFVKPFTDIQTLPGIIDEAKEFMGLGLQSSKTFSTNVLCVDIKGPSMPELIIVDLPGLVGPEDNTRLENDAELISRIVQGYVTRPGGVVLAVLSAEDDEPNQAVVKMALEANRSEQPVLGIITKPDRLYPGPRSEAMFLNLDKYQCIALSHGWHVLSNLGYLESLAYADPHRVERALFDSDKWTTFDSANLGADALRKKLSRIFFTQTLRQLPALIREIEQTKEYCQSEIQRRSSDRVIEEKQRAFLVVLSQRLHCICQAACNATYYSPFFDGADETDGPGVRKLRSYIQGQGKEFAHNLHTHGAQWKVVENSEWSPNKTIRKEAIDKVLTHLQTSRGCELPGTYDPIVISKVFQEYSRPWESIAREYVTTVWQQAKLFLQLLLKEHAGDDVSNSFQRLVIDEEMDTVLKQAEQALEFLLQDRMRPAATFNDDFVQDSHETRRKRLQAALLKHLVSNFRPLAIADVLDPGPMGLDDRIAQAVSSFGQNMESDLERDAAEQILDKMQAYYKVAMNRFIDNVPSFVVESYIVKYLLEVFEPLRAHNMDANLVQQIVGGFSDTDPNIESLLRKLELLNEAEAVCKRHVGQPEVSVTAPSEAGESSVEW